MKKIIFINNPAAVSGGALTILRQIVSKEINKYSNKDYVYYVFCSLPEFKKFENSNIKIINVKAKKWLDRIKWDLWGLKNWSKKHHIKANLILSLQNTAPFYYKNVPQLLYIRQALPFVKEVDWNVFNRKETGLWFYKHIYKYFIGMNIKNVNYIIAQSQWMKERISGVFNFSPKRIVVIPTFINLSSLSEIPRINFGDDKFHIFYPAAPYVYKNHKVIIKALRFIKNQEPRIFAKLIIHFTFHKEDNKTLTQLANKLQVKQAIRFEGSLPYQKVLEFYKSVNLVVFPSYVETMGLPLLEAAIFGLPILVSDLPFSREIISTYEGAQFVGYKNEVEWAKNIIECYRKKSRFRSFYPQTNISWGNLFKLIDSLLK